MFANTLRALTLLAAALAASCKATSYPYHFEPSPAEVQVEASAGGPLVARVLVGVMGAERLGKESSGHPDLLVRVRIEAKGPGPVTFDPASATVLGPDLSSFGPARVAEGTTSPLVVPQGGSEDVTLRFAFPKDGDLRMPRLTGVNVSLVIDTPAGARELSVSLARNEYERSYRGYDDGLYPHWHWHMGYFYARDC